jgi:bifunctional DNA-binding transcriptional regulator/antitoxin component of YhaV-PrlF toxin-antitoxin module
MPKIYGVVKAHGNNSKGALVLGIPKLLREELKIEKGTRFVVRADEGGRLVYERDE